MDECFCSGVSKHASSSVARKTQFSFVRCVYNLPLSDWGRESEIILYAYTTRALCACVSIKCAPGPCTLIRPEPPPPPPGRTHFFLCACTFSVSLWYTGCPSSVRGSHTYSKLCPKYATNTPEVHAIYLISIKNNTTAHTHNIIGHHNVPSEQESKRERKNTGAC